jgi:hypothetical protein
MADSPDNLGELTVSVTGDFSELQDAIDQSVTVAAEGSNQIASSFQAIADASGLAGGDLAIFQSVLEQDASAGIALEQSLSDLADSAKSVGDAVAGAAASALEDLQSAAQGAGDAAGAAAGNLDDAAVSAGTVSESAHEAESGLQGMAEGFLAVGEALAITEGLKEFIETAVETYGETQNVITSFELLGQSSEEAEANISNLSDMSLTLAVPFGDLEQSARRLTVAFQGVEGIDITDVLTTAADSAALTGKSFDQVTTALQRVEVTGAVTSRQLLQLGITWQQLAQTADSSVAEVQALLKKGGQDATADLQLVMETINAMASGAAAAQAQTILGQITILENQVTLLFDSIGQAIAPVMATIIGAIGEGVQAARSFLTAFQELPAPIQNVAVVVALAAAALVPLTAAAAALGLTLNALTMIGPAWATLMTAMGIAATEDAAGETAATIATAAHGAAADVAATKVGGLALAETGAAGEAGGLATALGTAGVGGALALIGIVALSAGTALAITVDNISQLKAKWTDAMTSIRSQNILDAIQAGASLQALQDIGNSTVQIKAAFGSMGTGALTVMQEISASMATPIQTLYNMGYSAQQIQTALKGVGTAAVSAWQAFDSGHTIDDMAQIGMNVDKITAALNKMGPAGKNNFGMLHAGAFQSSTDFDILNTGIVVLGSGLQTLSANTNAVVAAQAKLKQAVTDDQISVTQLTIALKTAQATNGDVATASSNLAAAQVKLDAANKAVATSIGDTGKAAGAAVDPITTFMAAQGKLSDAVTNSGKVIDWLNGELDKGVASINGISIAFNLLPAAINQSLAALQKQDAATVKYLQTLDQTNPAVTTFENILGGIPKSATPAAAAITSVGQSSSDAGGYFKNLGVDANTTGTVLVGVGATASGVVVPSFAALKTAADLAASGQTALADDADGTVTVLGNVAYQAKSVVVPAYVAQQSASTNLQGVIIGQNSLTEAQGKAMIDAAGGTTTNTSAIILNGKAQGDAATQATIAANAAVVLANKLQLQDQAFADGKLAVQDYNGQVQIVNTATQSSVINTGNFTAAIVDLSKAMPNAEGATNAEADAIIALGDAAADATTKVKNLNSAGGGGGGGGGGGEGAQLSGMEDLGSTALVSLQTLDPFLSQFTNPGSGAVGNPNESLAGYSPENTMQAIANETNQAVQSIYGTFIPAAQAAANELAGLQSEANATGKTLLDTFNGVDTVVSPQLTAMAQVAAANATAVTANTTAVTANTAAVVVALTAAQTSFIATATAGDAIVTTFADLPGTIQDYLDSMNATLVAYDDTTGALQFTTTAANGLVSTFNSAVAANELLTPATTTAAAAMTSVAVAATSTGAAISGLAAVATTATTAVAAAAVAITAAAQAQSAAAQFSNTPMSNALYAGGGAGGLPTGAFGPGQYGTPLNGYAGDPNAGIDSSSPAGGGVTLNINVTGNSVTSTALVNQLANQVGSVIINNLRTVGGLKL